MPTPAKSQIRTEPPALDSFSRRAARIKELTAAAEQRSEPQAGVPAFRFPAGSIITAADAASGAPAPAPELSPGVVMTPHATTQVARGSDPFPIRASYPDPAIGHDLLPAVTLDVLVDETLSLAPARPHTSTISWSLLRAPAGSTARPDSGRFRPDVPGLFVLEATLGGGWTRELLVAAYPVSALDAMVFPPRMGLERRRRLRAITRDQRVTGSSIAAALERGPTTDFRALLGITGEAPFDPTIFGG